MRISKLYFLSLTALLFSFSNATAFDFEADGIFYSITSENNREVKVTNNFSSGNQNTNSTYSGEITVPSSVSFNRNEYNVTSVGSYAFGGLYSGCRVTKVNLPSSVSLIEDSAFENCTNLNEITGIENVTSIGANAFYTCSVLKNFDFGDNIITIGKQAFCNCYSLTELKLKDTLISIGEKAFYYCTNLKYIIFGKGIKIIEANAFANCSALSDVFFTALSSPEISNSAFSGIRALSQYVPSTDIYGFGTDYLTFSENTFQYNGKVHQIEYVNNVRNLLCSVSEPFTEINAGKYSSLLEVSYTGSLNLDVEIPYDYTITRKPLLIRVNNAERKYGEENPAFSSVAYGFAENENFENFDRPITYLCSATTETQVGKYIIVPVVYTQNYEVTLENGTLTVSPVVLTVKAEDVKRLYGDVNPDFSLRYDGFVNSENENVLTQKPVATTPATQFSPVGEYPITVSGGEAKNYVFNYIEGILYIVDTLGVPQHVGEDEISISLHNGEFILINKPEEEICRVYDLNGKLLLQTKESTISSLSKGLYILKIGKLSFKITL